MTALHNAELHQEQDRLPWQGILLVAALVLLVGVLLVVWAWYSLQRREDALRPTRAFPERELGPRRPIHNQLEDVFGEVGRGQLMNERKRDELSRFQWIDRQQRIVAIPIDEAMTLVIEENRP
ncbi:MAG TPA: hypothetical protein VF881_16520 [Polyangiaceae bacterium]